MNSTGLFQAQALIALLVLATPRVCVAADDVVIWHLPHTVVTQAALDAAPLWAEDQPNPPLATRRAMDVAREKLLKIRPESANWKLRGLDLKQVGRKGQWMYVVRFEIPNTSPHLIPAPYDVIVLMDGRVVESGVKRSLGEDISTYFGFDDASVRSVLQYYSDLSGKELVIEYEGPERATITITKRTLTKKEALAFLERELREQAGLLLVPVDSQSVAARSAKATPSSP